MCSNKRILGSIIVGALFAVCATVASPYLQHRRKAFRGGGGNGITTNLNAYWQFDENTGTTTADFTANNNDGTFSATPTWVTGKFGSGVDIDRDDSDYIDVGNNSSLDLGSTFTVSVWAKIDSNVNDGQWFLSKDVAAGRSWSFGFVKSGSVRNLTFQSSGTGHVSTTDIASHFGDATWHHYAVTLSGGTMTFWVDGSSGGTASVSAPAVTTTNLRIGRREYSGAEEGLTGQLDEIKIFSVALSSGDIASEASL